MAQSLSARRSRAYMSQYGITMLHLKNPWMVAFWSFAFPGCGHLMLGRTWKGLILVVWELIVNTNAHVNLAIMYSLVGNFDMAREVVNLRWFLLYIGLYVFALWDSYRGAIEFNKLYLLADREDAGLTPQVLGAVDTNFLDKRSPWFATVLSLLSPGLGYLYLHEIVEGFFFICWTIVVMYCSHAVQSVHYTMVGDFEHAKSILNMQWLMYLPSIYGFVLHDTYVSAIEFNKLLEKEQSKFLRNRYQYAETKMPF